MEKKKLDDFTKFKLVYCGELLLFAVIFAVLGVLFLTKVLPITDWKIWVFPILTLCGGIYFVADFILMLVSPKKRAKNSFIDKILPLPVALGVMGFDVYAIISNITLEGDAREEYLNIFAIVLGCVLCYYAAVYLFEGIYHWFVPSKALTYAWNEAEEKIKEEEEKERAEQAQKEAQESEEKVED